MRQKTLFGNSIELASGERIRPDNGTLVPNLTTSVEFVYNEATKTFNLVKELLPHIEHRLLRTPEEMSSYLSSIRRSKVYAIDTEVDGLNPMLDKIAGISIYTPYEQPAYIPINHDFYEYNLDAREFVRELAKMEGVVSIMHNSSFDQKVLKKYAQVWVPVTIDTMVAAHVLNENEPKGLKYQWNKYLMGGKYTEMSYSDLFEKRKFSTFDPERITIYATLDALMTYQLAEFQMKFLNLKSPECKTYGLESVAKVFHEIEMPVRRTATRMEERGINFDLEENSRLEVLYNKRIREAKKKLKEFMDTHEDEIMGRISPQGKMKITNPINWGSNQQLEYILYEGLGVEIDEALKKAQILKRKKSKNPTAPPNLRPVGDEALQYFKEVYPEHKEFFNLLSEYRELEKIYGTFIVGLAKEVNPYTKKIHGNFNTTGTVTGRLSSSSPNLQNIPGRNKDIRPQFMPSEGKVMIGVDYS